MDNIRFADVMQQERERLHQRREEIFNQQQEPENRLAAFNREFGAIDAYEAAKSSKPARQSRGARAQRARQGSRREALLEVIRGNPDGLKRGEILERMGVKGDKAVR